MINLDPVPNGVNTLNFISSHIQIVKKIVVKKQDAFICFKLILKQKFRNDVIKIRLFFEAGA
jgi:hypothetical protein